MEPTPNFEVWLSWRHWALPLAVRLDREQDFVPPGRIISRLRILLHVGPCCVAVLVPPRQEGE